jgi:hypothetical protein
MRKKLTLRLSCFVCFYMIASFSAVSVYAQTNINRSDVLKIGKMIPNAQLTDLVNLILNLKTLKEKLKSLVLFRG